MTTIMFPRSISRNIFISSVYYYGFLRYRNINYYSILSLIYTWLILLFKKSFSVLCLILFYTILQRTWVNKIIIINTFRCSAALGVDGKSPERVCIQYTYIICMFTISAKYVWRQNIEIKPDLTIWPSETLQITKKNHHTAVAQNNYFIFRTFIHLRIVHILPTPTSFAAYIHVLYGTQKKSYLGIYYNSNIIK